MAQTASAGRRRSELKRLNLADGLIVGFLALFSLLILYPFYNTILISVTPQVTYIREPFMLFPKELTGVSFRYVFENKAIWTGMWVTVRVTVLGTLYNILLTVMMAYALNHDYPGKKFFVGAILFTMYFGGGLIPMYILIGDLGMMNTLSSMILPTGINISYLMVMRKYFRNIPEELEESAKIDGANDILIMFRIILPLALPMVVTFVIYYGVERWNEWYQGMLYIKSASRMPLQLILRNIVANSNTILASESMQEAGILPFADGIKMAAVIVTMLPVMILYPFMQKYFVSGLTAGAVKG
ncbi:MAG: carbohydrate ABC transporter permease [Christensenellaceae bacterium]|jgi:putative aldouronate transport system permease protein|nr:carbohydrate ABC transporter permease [Christensenellaceae bacterium]